MKHVLILSETGRKTILVPWHRTWMNCFVEGRMIKADGGNHWHLVMEPEIVEMDRTRAVVLRDILLPFYEGKHCGDNSIGMRLGDKGYCWPENNDYIKYGP